MAWTAATAILFLVWKLSSSAPTETKVICTFSEDCVLPCTFKAAGEEVIHWNRNKASVHVFYHDSDHVDKQDKHFKGRTSLFKNLIKNGNASLLLRNCNIEDSGTYQCYTSTKQGDQDQSVHLKVTAPIQLVNINKIGKEIICSSKDIYPAPTVSWTTDPPTPADTLKDPNSTTVDVRGLYSVQSKVRMLGDVSDYTYICSVTSGNGLKWTASMRQQEIDSTNGEDMVIPCIAPETFKPNNFTLTWTFTKENKSEVILKFNSQTKETSKLWENRTRVDPDQALAGNGSLWLQNLENSAHTGTYTCQFSAFKTQHLVYTDVSFAPEPHRCKGFRSHGAAIGASALFVCAIMVLVISSIIRCDTCSKR
ncbi:hypothetical protein GJAV_G00136960 [Gymnothorax javanicus]|nr:hypothetical protein GJAV_G00136960 [Gymnothorax javanicus]